MPSQKPLTGNAGDFSGIALKAASRGDLGAVKSILKQRPDWLNRAGPHGRTLVWEACLTGRIQLVTYLVGRRKARTDICGTRYTPYFLELTCLAIAKLKKRWQVVDYLQSKTAALEIHDLAYLGELDSVQRLANQNPGVLNAGRPQHEMNLSDRSGPDYVSVPNKWATPLCYALKGGCAETVRFLIQAGACIKGIEQQLFQAADEKLELVRLLLENGADAGQMPSVSPDDDELVKLVRRFGGSVESTYQLSEELVYTCRGDRGGNVVTVLQLIRNGADVNHQDRLGKTASHRAAKAGFVETLIALAENGAKLNLIDHTGETPLFAAIRSTIRDRQKRRLCIEWLLKNGADPTAVNARGESANDLMHTTGFKVRRKTVRKHK